MRGLVTVAFTYTLMYASTVNVLMDRDGRYAAERFLKAYTPPFARIYVLHSGGARWYLPRLGGFDVWSLDPTQHKLVGRPPELLVLNDAERARWRHAPAGRQFLEDLDRGTLGYHRVFSGRTGRPRWAIAARTRLFSSVGSSHLSNLTKINSSISIYARKDLATGALPTRP